VALGLGDSATVTRTLVTTMKAFQQQGLDASTAMDILTKTVQQGDIPIDSLAGALGRVNAVAAAVGVPFREVGAAIATFTRVGVSAAEAVTGLRGLLLGLEAPGSKAAEAIKELYGSTENLRTSIRDKGLAATLLDLITKTHGNVDALKELVPNVRALNELLANAKSQGKDYAAVLEEIRNSYGTLSSGFEATNETLAQQWKRLEAQAEVLGVRLGEAIIPVVKDLVPLMNNLATAAEAGIKAFADLPEPVREIILALAALLAAGGPIVLLLGQMLYAAKILIPLLGGGGATGLAGAAGIAGTALAGLGVAGLAGAAIFGLTKVAEAVSNVREKMAEASTTSEKFSILLQTLGERQDTWLRTQAERFFNHGIALSDMRKLVKESGGTPEAAGFTFGPTLPQSTGIHPKESIQSFLDAAKPGFSGLAADLSNLAKSMNATGPATKTFTEQLKEAQAKVDGLSGSVRNDLIAAIKSHAFTLDQLKTSSGLSELSLKLLENSIKGETTAHTAAQREIDRHAKALKSVADAQVPLTESEKAAIKPLLDLNADVSELAETFGVSAAAIRDYAQSLGEARAGAESVSKEIKSVADAVEKAEEAGLKQAERAEEAIGNAAGKALAEQLRTVTEYAERNYQLTLHGTDLKVRQLNVERNAVLASNAQVFGSNSALYQAMKKLVDDFYDHQIERVREIDHLQRKADWFSAIAEGLSSLGQETDGIFGSIVSGFGRISEAAANYFKLLAANKEAGIEGLTGSQKAGALIGGASAVIGATGTGSTTGRTISGAAAGAAAGIPFAGVTGGLSIAVGAGIGALVGLFRGMSAAAKEAKKEAEEARVKIAELKDEVVRSHGGWDQLASDAKRVGFNFQAAFQLSDPKQLQKSLDDFEGALQRMRDGVKSFAEGATQRIDAFYHSFDKLKSLDPKDFKALQDMLAKEAPEMVLGAIEVAARQQSFLNALGGTTAEVQQEFDRMGLYAGTAFAQSLRENGWEQALKDAAPMFDQLEDLQGRFGFQLSGSAEQFRHFYDTAKNNADVVGALDGLTKMIVGAGNALFLDQELFSAFGEDAVTQFTRLTERGVSANDALVLMQPTLQALWEAQDKFGLTTDDATQKLIDQARTQGLVGADMREVNQQILNVLKSIAKVLGADIPENVKKAGSAMDETFKNRRYRIPVDFDFGDSRQTGPAPPARPAGPEPAPAAAASAGAGGYGVAVLQIDGRTFAREIVPYIPGELRRAGAA
jgi:TP901 family phage tail tape measure protein